MECRAKEAPPEDSIVQMYDEGKKDRLPCREFTQVDRTILGGSKLILRVARLSISRSIG